MNTTTMSTTTDAIEAALKAAEAPAEAAAKEAVRPAEAASAKPDAPKASADARPRRQNEGSWQSRLGVALFGIAATAVVILGYLNRDVTYLTAEEGLGYALGIVGAVMMLMLLAYPMRKRMGFMRRWGAVKTWFSTHMVMGVIAPLAILFHANFQLGSLNSNVALYVTLTVAISGVIGRFIYTKVHYGLSGGRMSLSALREDALTAKGQLSAEFAFAPQLRARLQAFEDKVLSPSKGPIHSLLRIMTLGMRVRITKWRMDRFLNGALTLKAKQSDWSRQEIQRHRRDAKRYLKSYIRTVRKVAELGFYERLFSFWHLLHFPLFLMLTVAAVIHVVAVHMY